MPTSPFAITTGSNTLLLNTEHKAEASFTVSNISGRPLRGRGVLQPLGSTPAGWLSIVGQAERDFGIGVAQQYAVQVAVPPDAAPGDYTFRLNAVGVDNPDDSFTQGPVVTFHVLPSQNVRRPFPWWIVAIVAAVVLVAAIVVGAILLSRRPVVEPASTPTVSASDTPIPTPTVDVTATASFAATATANAANATATAEANAKATADAQAAAAATASANATATQAAVNAQATASANATATQAAINAKATDAATPIPIIVQNQGGFALSFSVRYVLNGQELSQQTDNFPVGQEKTLFVPKAATSLSLQVQIVAGKQLSFNIGGPVRTCKKISGTTLFPNVNDC